MLREIAVLRTLAGTPVPHPGFIAGCDDLDVLGVVFYLMEEVDGFNPGNEMAEAYVRDAGMRHRGRPVLRRRAWRGSATSPGRAAHSRSIKRPGSFLARQVPQFLRLLESYRHENYAPESLPEVAELAEWLEANRPPDGEPGIMHGDAHLNNVLLRRDNAGAGGVHRLGDVHGRRPAARSRLDADLLAARPQPDRRRFAAGRAGRAGEPSRTARCLLGPPAAAKRRGWTGISRWPASSSAS